MKRTQGALRVRSSVLWAAVGAQFLLAAGCGNSSEVSVIAPSTRCTISVNATTSTVPAAGGSGRLTVDVARECSWAARAEASWISLSGSQGQGPATLTYSVAPNPNGTSRRSGILVEGERVEVAQEAAPCVFDVSQTNVEVGAAAGETTLSVAAPGGCSWTARSNVPWIGNIAPSNGQGTASVRFTVLANSGGGRTGSLVVAGVTVIVSQAGVNAPPPPPPPSPPPPSPPTPPPTPPAPCSVSISPSNATAPSSGGRITVGVTSTSGCTWTVTSNAAWITVVEGQEGSGDGTVALNVAPNPGTIPRTGTVSVEGRTFAVHQDRTPCSYSIKPDYYNAGRGPDVVRVDVTAANGCTWTASSPVSWAIVADGRSGSGNGTVQLRIDANSGASRSATLTIAGLPFALAQNGCQNRIKPDHYNAGRGPDTIDIDVTAEAGCTWRATSPVSWVTVVEGRNGSGDGRVRLRVEPNNGDARSATLQIAGEPFLLRQQGR